MVLTIGILGNGLFGIGLRAVQDREQNILRRLHLAPISPAPILFATLVSGLIVYMPGAVLTILLAHWIYLMPIPSNLLSLLIFLAIANLAFRAIGMIVASVANSMNEAQIIIQIIYFPMLFLSGTTFPISSLPDWIRTITLFIPATYVTSGLQTLIDEGAPLFANANGIAALLTTAAAGSLLSYHLFRWDKDDRIPARARVWVAAVISPFLLLGVWESYRGTQSIQQDVASRQLARNRNWLIRDARVFTGDGQVLDRANVYIRNGIIVDVAGQSAAAPANQSQYTIIEGAGKTLMPGLIDMHAHFGGPPLITGEAGEDFSIWPETAAKAYLYSGVTAVKSVGDVTDGLLRLRERTRNAEFLGTEIFMTGPLFTAPGGHGTEYFRYLPEMTRRALEPQMAAAYSVPSEAAARVDELAGQKVDGIKIVLEAGGSGMLFERLDLGVMDAIAEAAARHGLPVVVHTGSIQDIRDAIARKVHGLEHGSLRDPLPADIIGELAAKSLRYDPTLSVVDSMVRLAKKDTSMLDDPLVRQTVRSDLLSKMKTWIQNNDFSPELAKVPPIAETNAAKNLKAAFEAGVPLVMGTDAGNPGVFHGPAVHWEMEIWKEAGIPNIEILKAATHNAASLLGASSRIGRVAKDYEANLLLVDGNPVEDITATRRISDVFFKGERVRRSALFQTRETGNFGR